MLIGSLLSACGPAQFNYLGPNNKSTADNNTESIGAKDPLTCDPTTNTTPAVLGLTGSAYYLDSSQPRYDLSTDYPKYGHKVTKPVELSQLFVPTRDPLAGFPLDNNQFLKDDLGNLLTVYYGLDLHSSIKLSDADAPGKYQFAIISDDGAALSLANSQNDYQTIVNNEHAHPSTMACATQTVDMVNGALRVPMHLTYFEGPLVRISLILMWRRIPDNAGSSGLADVECGRGGDGYFFSWDGNSKTSVPLTAYQNLLARGWKPLNANNYELTASQSLCPLSPAQ